MKLYSYNQGSQSAKALAEALGIKRIKHEGKHIKIKDVLINWGCSNITRSLQHVGGILNTPESIAKAVNKLSSFRTMEGKVTIPEFTESRDEAVKWLGEGITVVARATLTGHSGQGITIHEPADAQLPNVPLYVKYIKKEYEYRVHVFQGKVFFVQKKVRKLEVPDDQVNWAIRNLKGGFVYANKDIECPAQAALQAVAAIESLGLDFGAVDIIYNKRSDKYFVLEVNTACGLEGTTLIKYVEQFQNYHG